MAVKMDPDNVEVYYNLAWTSTNLHMMTDTRVTGANCEKYLNELLKRYPSHYQGNMLRGFNMQPRSKSYPFYMKAFEVRPHMEKALDWMHQTIDQCTQEEAK